jgi:flagellar motor switch protein FliG
MTTAATLDDGDRAAIMVMLMEEHQAAQVLSRLNPTELRSLGERMCALGEIGPEAIAAAAASFVIRTEQVGLSAHNRVDQVRTLMSRALGDVKASGMMTRIAPVATSSPTLELARWLNADVLLPLILDEHPQVIAVLLVQLDPGIAATVLHGLPEAVQSQVVHRIASLGPVSADAVTMLEAMLSDRIENTHGPLLLTMGGPREAAEIINNVSRSVERRVMPALTKMDKAIARRVENEMFKFEHLLELDEKSLGTLLREVDSDTLISALKGLEAPQREFFLAAMSSRAADGVRDEIELRGRMKKSEVEAAQKLVVAAARKLADAGDIIFGSGNDEYV